MDKKGFTLTEMIAVIVIVGIVLLIAIPVSRRMIINNQQEKISIKEKAVEKAMASYAEVDNRKSKCVKMTIEELIQKGYIKDGDKDGDLGKYSNKTTLWYYYKETNEIKDNPIPDIQCNAITSSENDNSADTGEYDAVTVPIQQEKVSVTIIVNKDDTDMPFPDLIPYSPQIRLYVSNGPSISTGDSSACTSERCTLEVMAGSSTIVNYTVSQKGYKVQEQYSAFVHPTEDTEKTVTLVSDVTSYYVSYYFRTDNIGKSYNPYFNYLNFAQYSYAGCLAGSSKNKNSCPNRFSLVFLYVKIAAYNYGNPGDKIDFYVGSSSSLGSGTMYYIGSMYPNEQKTAAFYVEPNVQIFQVKVSGSRTTSASPGPEVKVNIWGYS